MGRCVIHLPSNLQPNPHLPGDFINLYKVNTRKRKSWSSSQHLGGGLCIASPMFPYPAGHRIRRGSQEYSSSTGIKHELIILSLFKSWLTQAELIIHAIIIFSVRTHAVVMFCVIIHVVIIFSVGIHTVQLFHINIHAVLLMCQAISPSPSISINLLISYQ